MNIGFEAKRLFTNHTGLGNYSRFIVGALSLHQPESTYYLYTPRGTPHKDARDILERSNVKVITPGTVYKYSYSTSLWRTWGISKEKTIRNLNIFHGLSQELPIGIPRKIKKVVTVHDLIFLRFPKFYNPIDVSIYKHKVTHACKKADVVIAISKQTADDLVQFLKIDESKIKIIYQGCHANFRTRLSAQDLVVTRQKYNLPSEYILNVGTVETRKNVMHVVRAVAALPPHLRIPLIVIGKQTSYHKEVVAEAQRLKVLDNIRFFQNIPFVDFPAIYQGAKVFVYPSLFEGFGIPLVEAIESGIPVITSTGSCFTEAAGPGAIYTNPLDVEELKTALVNVLEDENLRKYMTNQSTNYIERFKPQVIAGNLFSLYESLQPIMT